MNTLHIKICKPTGLVAEIQSSELILETVDGQITILPAHSAYTGILGSGMIRYNSNGSAETQVVCGGFVSVINDQVEVLVDEIFELNEITVSEATSKLEELEKKLPEVDLNDTQSQPLLNDISKYRAFLQAIAS